MILTMHRVTAGRRGAVTGAHTNADDGQAQEKRTAPARGKANVTLPLKEYAHSQWRSSAPKSGGGTNFFPQK